MVSHFRWKRCESKYYKATCQWVAWCICGRNSQYTHYQRLALCSFIAASALIARNYGWDLEPNKTKSRFLRRMLVRVTLLLQGINTHTHTLYIFMTFCLIIRKVFHLNVCNSTAVLFSVPSISTAEAVESSYLSDSHIKTACWKPMAIHSLRCWLMASLVIRQSYVLSLLCWQNVKEKQAYNL